MGNHVIILAGGTGSRVGENMPKQFLIIHNKPVIVHTIECFEKNDLIDDVLIVCIKEWIPYVYSLIQEFHLTKVKWVVEGGPTGYHSTKNGIFALKGIIDRGDNIIIHDAARPIVPQKAIIEMLSVAQKRGNASLAIPCYETVLFTEDGLSGDKQLDRNCVMRVQTPQTYRFGEILDLYEKAEEEKKSDFVYANLVVIHYGGKIYFSKGFTNNIKITTKEDLKLCESLMNFPEDELFAS